MTSVPNVAERRRFRRAGGIRARARIAMATLAAAAALVLSAAPLAHASSGAGVTPARGSAAAATSDSQVTIAGTISWTQTGPPPLDYGPNAGQDVQTGTFHIDMASDTGLFGTWQDVGSSYQATDNFTESYQDSTGCTATTTGSASVGGSFPPNTLSLDAVAQNSQTWVGVHIWLNPAETYTTSAPCFATVTTPAATVIQPYCFGDLAHLNSAGLDGLLTGSGSRGTIKINCSGGTPGYNGTITYSATGTLTVRADRYVFILPRAAKTPSRWHQVLFSLHHDHASVDIPISVGTPYMAITEGTVTYAGGACGKGIKLHGTDGVLYTYCHGSKRLVPSGTKVTPGTELGLTGNTGVSTGPHLHFQITYPAGQLRCPQTLLWDLYALTQPPPDEHTVHTLPTTGCIKPPS